MRICNYCSGNTTISIGQQPIVWQFAYAPQRPLLDELVARAAGALQLNVVQPIGVANGSALEQLLLDTPFLCGIEFDASLVSEHNWPNQ